MFISRKYSSDQLRNDTSEFLRMSSSGSTHICQVPILHKALWDVDRNMGHVWLTSALKKLRRKEAPIETELSQHDIEAHKIRTFPMRGIIKKKYKV